MEAVRYKLDEDSISPSVKDGISEEAEMAARAHCAVLVQEVGVVMELPQVTIARAIVLLHRYLWVTSLRNVDADGVVAAVVLLASKLDDREKKPLEVASILQALKAHGTGAAAEYCNDFKKAAVAEERRLLRYLGFHMEVEDPYKYIVFYLDEVLKEEVAILQHAWGYLTDSLRTDACVHFYPHEIATGCVYLALRKAGKQYPDEAPWWEVFDVTTDTMVAVVCKIETAYRIQPAPWKE